MGNPGVFHASDTAYVLSFSLVMLNTDAHSNQIKKKMSVDEFVRNNRGINGSGNDLPKQYLSDLYHAIVNRELKMHADGSGSNTTVSLHIDAGNLNSRKRQMLQAIFQCNVEHMSHKLGVLWQQSTYSYVSNEYKEATQLDMVPLILESIWYAVLGALSSALLQSNEAELVTIAMAGFKHGIIVCARFGMAIQHDALLNAVERFK